MFQEKKKHEICLCPTVGISKEQQYFFGWLTFNANIIEQKEVLSDMAMETHLKGFGHAEIKKDCLA